MRAGFPTLQRVLKGMENTRTPHLRGEFIGGLQEEATGKRPMGRWTPGSFGVGVKDMGYISRHYGLRARVLGIQA